MLLWRARGWIALACDCCVFLRSLIVRRYLPFLLPQAQQAFMQGHSGHQLFWEDRAGVSVTGIVSFSFYISDCLWALPFGEIAMHCFWISVWHVIWDKLLKAMTVSYIIYDAIMVPMLPLAWLGGLNECSFIPEDACPMAITALLL